MVSLSPKLVAACVALASGIAVVLAACVGDSGTNPIIENDAASGDAPGVGGEGEPCYGNGSCNGTLSCISKVCVNLGSDAAATDAGTNASDAAPGDAGNPADGGPDAADPCVGGNVTPMMTKMCLDGGGNYICAVGAATSCVQTSASCAGGSFLQCTLNSDCAQGMICCATNIYQGATPTACPFFPNNPVTTVCVSSNGVGPGKCPATVDYPTCQSNGDCSLAPNTACRPVFANSDVVALGVCRP